MWEVEAKLRSRKRLLVLQLSGNPLKVPEGGWLGGGGGVRGEAWELHEAPLLVSLAPDLGGCVSSLRSSASFLGLLASS